MFCCSFVLFFFCLCWISFGCFLTGLNVILTFCLCVCVCICFGKDGDPELLVYYDEEQLWKFSQDSNKKSSYRTVDRKVISLPFAPIDRGIVFTPDSRFIFIALKSSQKLLDQTNDEKGNIFCSFIHNIFLF